MKCTVRAKEQCRRFFAIAISWMGWHALTSALVVVRADLLVAGPRDGVLEGELLLGARRERQLVDDVVGYPVLHDDQRRVGGAGGALLAQLARRRCDELDLDLVLGRLGQHLDDGDARRHRLGVVKLRDEAVRRALRLLEGALRLALARELLVHELEARVGTQESGELLAGTHVLELRLRDKGAVEEDAHLRRRQQREARRVLGLDLQVERRLERRRREV
mmetsp:Transcript_7415/g.14851  ORF Transcript_7415/g.14851 Transcript_7415/m.14851 type:complete len:220 (-) Transcript_7415:747-1406(-)